MIYNHHSTSQSIQSKEEKKNQFLLIKFYSIVKNLRRKRLNDNDESSSYSPMFTLQSSNCLMIDNNQVQSTFIWSQSIEYLSSIELIYHIDSIETKIFSIPIRIKFKHSQTLKEFFTINTYLQFDSNRDFYFLNIIQYIIEINNQNLIIETILNNKTCQTSHTYMIISSNNIHSKPNQTLKLNPTLSFDLHQLTQTDLLSSSSSMCKLQTIQIKFEDLGLAYLIIRPKEYTFTYCDGTCSYSTLQQQQQSSMHALFQSFVNRKNPNIPQPTCAPSQFADDNFLLRQIDGNIEIYPIKDVIVKQCTCL